MAREYIKASIALVEHLWYFNFEPVPGEHGFMGEYVKGKGFAGGLFMHDGVNSKHFVRQSWCL